MKTSNYMNDSQSINESVDSHQHNVLISNDANTLKGKLATLEYMFDEIYTQMQSSRDEIQRLLRERELYENLLEDSTIKDKNELLKDLELVMKDMEGYFIKQKLENEELQLKIARLKTQKTVLQGKFIALQRRITNLEGQVGNDEINFE